MLAASAFSLASSGPEAAEQITRDIGVKLNAPVSLLVCFATEAAAGNDIAEELCRRFPETPVFGGTSCRGVVTEAGVHLGPNAVGVLALSDPDGAYGAAAVPIGDDARAAVKAALEQALDEAGRAFETPALVWICQPPGIEEEVLAAVAEVVGPKCPIMGGSSADETISGGWRQFSRAGAHTDHVVVAVLFPSAPIGMAFKSGYAPTGRQGVITKSDGRCLIEIDGRPAAAVYSEWTDGLVDPNTPGVILQQSTPAPLARRVGAYGGVDEYVLSHPASIEQDGALRLFTEVSEGEIVHGMTGERQSLIDRAGRVVSDARDSVGRKVDVSGGLVIYCGGCMLALADSLEQVGEGMTTAFGGAPFLAAFTFGEQGALVSSGNRHGNLMIASTVFGRG